MSHQALPRPSFNAPEPERASKTALKVQARAAPLLQGKVSELPDAFFGWTMRLCGLAVVALLGLIVYELVVRSQLSWHAFGWKFFVQSDWNPVEEQFGALPFIYGTIVSSILSLIIAVPLAVGVAVFITEMCPVGLRGILSFTTELLAAIPSVIYGLWAIFILVPLLRTYVQPFLATTLGWTACSLRE
jgi:phosphate transport system permease protein